MILEFVRRLRPNKRRTAPVPVANWQSLQQLEPRLLLNSDPTGSVAMVDRPGDINNDGRMNNLDVTPFIITLQISGRSWIPNHKDAFLAQVSGGNFANADANADGLVNNLDITPFINLLSQSIDPNDIDENQDGIISDDDGDTSDRWNSSSSVLRRYGEDVVLKGFSGTTTEYFFDGLGMDTYWNTDFSTPFRDTVSRVSVSMLSNYGQSNFSTIYENDLGVSGPSPNPENVANLFFAEGIVERLNEVDHPVFRIPMTARYWLEGGKKVYTYGDQVTSYDRDTRTVTYSWGSTGSLVDSVNIVERNGHFHFVQQYSAQEYQQYITDLVYYVKEEVPDAVIILDLHWNFDRFGDSSTFDNIIDGVTESTVYAKQLPMALDQDSTGSRAGSAVRFWESVSETFGHKGSNLVDGTRPDVSSTHTNHITLSDNPAVDSDFASDIWFELYNEPWTDKFSNYQIDGNIPVTRNDNTSGTSPSDWDGYINGASSTTDDATFVGMMDLYTAVRERADNHIVLSGGSNWGWGAEALIALHTAIDTNANTSWDNVVLGVHPFMGWYQKADGTKDAEGFHSVISALQTLDTPILITEFGQYDGPGKINFDARTGNADEPDDNWNFTGTNDRSVSSPGNSNLYEWYHYAGYWDSATHTETGEPMSYNEAILRICKEYQISWSAWAGRPNSHGYGSSTGSTQPDVFTGIDASGNDDLRLTNPATAFNPKHQSQPMVKESATGGGSNWSYLWNHFVIEAD